MKNISLFFLAILAFVFLGGFPPARAQSNAPAPATINARILPTVWYSTLSAVQGEQIKIYAGIQNNSGKDFNGTADFYIDGAKISSVPFSSSTGTLKYVAADWVAEAGEHTSLVKISALLQSTDSLISYQSDLSNINVRRKITIQPKEKTKENFVDSVISSVDKSANVLADNLQSLKVLTKSHQTPSASGKSSGTNSPATSAISGLLGPNGGVNAATGAFNLLLDGAAALLKNWKLAAAGSLLLILLYLFLK